jgi:hypothetical protein
VSKSGANVSNINASGVVTNLELADNNLVFNNNNK